MSRGDSKDFCGVTIAVHLRYFAHLGSDMLVIDPLGAYNLLQGQIIICPNRFGLTEDWVYLNSENVQ
jgi:hypothetical protein